MVNKSRDQHASKKLCYRMKGGKSLADVAGDSAGQYLGLYYQDNINKQHNFCRNPMIKNVLAKTDDDVRKRAW